MSGAWITRLRDGREAIALSLFVCFPLVISGCEESPAASSSPAAETKGASSLEKAREILKRHPIADGHNDAPWAMRMISGNRSAEVDLMGDTRELARPMQTDIPRLREGGVGAQFWSVYIPCSMEGPGAAREVLNQIDIVYRMVERYPDHLALALSADDIVQVQAEGKIASLIGIEGGHAIENSLQVLRQLYRAGCRYMTLTHSDNTDWADSATDEAEHGGLNRFGEEVVREMNRLGMLVDLSHVSADCMRRVLSVTEAPVIFSHSSAKTLTGTERNVPDDVMDQVKKNKSLIMVTFVPSFVNEELRGFYDQRRRERDRLRTLFPDDAEEARAKLQAWEEQNPRPKATVQDVADHFDYIKDRIGVEYLGIGSDFDGTGSLPEKLDGASTYPNLIAELIERGYSEAELAKICGQNLVRVMREVEEVAQKLKAERPASELRYEKILEGKSNDKK